MNERRKPYPFDRIEPKWQAAWAERQTFHAPNPGEPGFDPARPKYYVLDMFPYPSGAGLHVGHPLGYIATDITARYKRMRGFHVLHPMGWDAFGLPAEQYAIKTGQHPRVTTERNVTQFKRQLERIGLGYDWAREVNTTDPGYFRWTQWIFLKIYGSWFDPERQRARPIAELEEKRRAHFPGETDSARRAFLDSQRLAYVAEIPVNWCPELGTVLANEEVVDGKSEVGGFPVVRRPMRQWMLRITAYAERLIDELAGLDWPESIKLLQKNWIGKSEGAEVIFKFPPGSALDSRAVSGDSPGTSPASGEGSAPADLPPSGESPDAARGSRALPGISVFTTRPDTLFGATYLVLAPENPLVDELTTPGQRDAVEKYRAQISSKSDLERTELSKEKTGVWTGAFALNPVNGEPIPIWIADYVLMGYGTGAIMAVPAHDERDWEFAEKFALPIREVVSESPRLTAGGESPCSAEPLACFSGEGFAVNSQLLDGLPTAEAKARITAWLEERGAGKKTVNYKLRDWLFSRQRYWGEPFPIVWENGEHRALPESELPLTPPPLDDFKPTGTGEPPLAKAREWVRYSTPHAEGQRRDAEIAEERGEAGKEGNGVVSAASSSAHLRGLGVSALKSPAPTRETNTMPQWAGSCWYYLRYCDPGNTERFVGAQAESYWMAGKDASATFENGGVKTKVGEANAKVGEANAKVGEANAKVGEANAKVGEANAKVGEANAKDASATFEDGEVKTKDAEANAKDGEATAKDANTDAKDTKGEAKVVNPPPKDIYPTSRDASREAAIGNPEAPSAFANVPLSKATVPCGGVDLYVGGTEHAVLHLLYARFWHKVLFDLGHVSTPEPFQRLVNQGMMLGEDGQKMSKSRGNVINPDDVIAEYGADAFRCYEMFMGPLEQMKPWSTTGVEGVSRFLARVWRLAMEENQAGEWVLSPGVQEAEPDRAQLKVIHATVKKVGEDIETLSFNTAISAMMVFVNAFTNAAVKPVSALRTLLILLNPFAPHLTEELWEIFRGRFGGGQFPGLVAGQAWPEFDAAILIEDEVELAVQVNGKVRDRLVVKRDAGREEIEAAALALPKIAESLAGLGVRKIIVVPGKLVNVVAG